jgi:hypothetical protein
MEPQHIGKWTFSTGRKAGGIGIGKFIFVPRLGPMSVAEYTYKYS